MTRRPDVRRRRRQPDHAGQPAEGEVVAARRRRVFRRYARPCVRGGYGMYWAPCNYPVPEPGDEQLRPGRLHARTRLSPTSRAESDRRSPTRSRTASSSRAGSSLGAADRRRHEHQLRRSEQQGAARAAVLRRLAARAARQHGDHGELRRRARRLHRASADRTTRRSISTSSIRSTWPSARLR